MCEFAQAYDGILVQDECAMDSLKCEFEEVVKELNEKYPNQKKLKFNGHNGDSSGGQWRRISPTGAERRPAMIPTEINGIILTDDCIESIKTIQEGEYSWMETTLEKAIDLALDIDSPDIDSTNRLTLISEIRIIKKHIQSISSIQHPKK